MPKNPKTQTLDAQVRFMLDEDKTLDEFAAAAIQDALNRGSSRHGNNFQDVPPIPLEFLEVSEDL